LPVLILIDGLIGQMMEAVDFDHVNKKRQLPDKSTYCTIGTKYHDTKNVINSLYLDPNDLNNHNKHLQEKYRKIIQEETLVECSDNIKDAEYVVVAYGTMARIAKSAIQHCNANGHKIGMIRPITLWPFPNKAFEHLPKCKKILVTEMSMGQMINDVLIATRNNNIPVEFYGETGGVIPEVEDVIKAIEKMIGGK
jgi:2-oxoglutarate ferredoxin oxidoreductase subunit alpha